MGSLDEVKSAIKNNEIHESYKGASFKAETVSNIYKMDSIKYRVFVKKTGHRKFLALGGDDAYEFNSEAEADFAAKSLNLWAGT